jgi:hypothetical protein
MRSTADWLSVKLKLTKVSVLGLAFTIPFFALFVRSKLEGQTVPQATGAGSGYSDDADCEPAVSASPYIPVDSWIYPAVMRLYSLGYVDSAYINLRPWTRASVRHMLEETSDRIDDQADNETTSEPEKIYSALMQELDRYGRPNNCQKPTPSAYTESAYTILRGISGTPLRDSFHLGATVVNDYGRPYAHGFNNFTGASGYASAGRYLIYARGELQIVPSSAAYSPTLSAQLAKIDQTTFYYSPNCWAKGIGCVPIPYNQHPTIPAGPISSTVQGQLLEAYVSAQYLNHIFSFGKQDFWQGPAVGAAMSYSNNAENVYSFRINRQEPLAIPLLSKITGPFRYEFMVGPLKGHTYPIDPWVHVEKVSFKPTKNLGFGFERTVIWGGRGHAPITVESFARSFFSLSGTSASVKNSSKDPGARFGAFDFSYRLPFLRDWVTLYADSEVHDDISPIDAPRRASWRPGIYLSHVPYLAKLELRAEAAYTDPPISNSNGGSFMYWEIIQRDGYTNAGQLFGDWVGREGKAGQGWLTYHLSGNEWVQLNYRYHKIAKDFIPGGTTLHDIGLQVVKRLGKDLEINGSFNYQDWKAPVYMSGSQTVTTTAVQVIWYPRK